MSSYGDPHLKIGQGFTCFTSIRLTYWRIWPLPGGGTRPIRRKGRARPAGRRNHEPYYGAHYLSSMTFLEKACPAAVIRTNQTPLETGRPSVPVPSHLTSERPADTVRLSSSATFRPDMS